MRNWARAAVVVVALAWSPAAVAADPSAVYNDYAADRVLSCTHSPADLRAALTDATLNQYGDPYTLIGMRLAVRKQLAGSCRRPKAPANEASGSTVTTTTSTEPTSTEPTSTKPHPSRKKPKKTHKPTAVPRPGEVRPGSALPQPQNIADSQSTDEGMVLLGVLLLLLTLGTGGWAAKRGFDGPR